MYLSEKNIKICIKEVIKEVMLFTPKGKQLDSKLLKRALTPEFIVSAFVDYYEENYDSEYSRLSGLNVTEPSLHNLSSDFAYVYAIEDIKEYLGTVLSSTISKNDMSIVLSFEEKDFEGELIRNLVPNSKKFQFLQEKDMSDIFKYEIEGTHIIKDGDSNPENNMTYTINRYYPYDKNISDLMSVGSDKAIVSQEDYGKTKKYSSFDLEKSPQKTNRRDDRTAIRSKPQPKPAVLDIYDDPESYEPTELFNKK